MELERTQSFREEYERLPKDVQRRADKTLRLLVQDLRHSSLEARIVDKKRRIWKARVNGGYRFTFHVEAGLLKISLKAGSSSG
jgi:mRNA-degrading endonuclease RelE of RelBE toxin-antitoxin system